jgi:hypothetical protein
MKQNIIFSCIIDGIYKEFITGEVTTLTLALKKEAHYTHKYLSAFSQEEYEFSSQKLKAIRKIKSLILNQKEQKAIDLNTFLDEDEKLNAYKKELLTSIKMQEVFSLEAENIPRYLHALGKASTQNAMLKQSSKKHMAICEQGIINTEFMKRYGLTLEQTEKQYTFKVIQYQKQEEKQYRKEARKIS